MIRILFVGDANNGRSLMAEGFARTRPDVMVRSAGVEPGIPNPVVIRVMAEAGVDISGQKPTALKDLAIPDLDVVITLSERARERCPLLPGDPVHIDWALPDPARALGSEAHILDAYRGTRDRIQQRVDSLFDHGYLATVLSMRNNRHTLLNTVSDGVLSHDMNRHLISFNAAAERITGFTAAEVLGRDCHDIFAGTFCSGRCAFCATGVPAFEDGPVETQIGTKGGGRRLVHLLRRVLTDPAGRPQGARIVFNDVTREQELARRAGEPVRIGGIIGRDQKILDVLDLVRQLSDSNVPVLIQGESGTGKELVAAAIHNEGLRANHAFIPVNCGALPEGLLESELFGHVKGSFTGAVRDKKGRFELADGGTIFLDEIGDISLAMQVKLLRVLQEGRFERVGGERTMKVDVRIISATNRNLRKEISAGRFREDLYYRLNVVPVYLPTLRERRNDIPLLVEHVLERVTRDIGRTGVTVSPEALDIMMSYSWHGNVRELQNWIQFALVKCRDTVIRPEHLPPHAASDDPPVSVGASSRPLLLIPRGRQRLDDDAVRVALEKSGNNRAEAARILGVSRATLYRFLESTGKPAIPPV